MEKAIAILTAQQANIEADIAAFDQVMKQHKTDGMYEKRLDLRKLSEEIESAIRVLKCKKEIDILEALIEDGRIKDPND